MRERTTVPAATNERGSGERTLVEAALGRLDEAAMAVMRSAATNAEQHEILGCLVVAHGLLHALRRLDPAAVEELLAQASRNGRRVSRPRIATAGQEVAGTPARRLQEVGPASPTTSSTTAAAVVEVSHAIGV